MHELSTAQNILDAVLLEAEGKKARRVKEVRVEVGELMQLDRKALADAIKVLLTGELLKSARIRVIARKASFSCRKCRMKWGMRIARKQLSSISSSLLVREPDSEELPLHFLPYLYPSFAHCPNCGSVDVATIEGDNIRLEKLVME